MVHQFFRDIANGLRALKNANIIHRDIKPENILLCNKKSLPTPAPKDYVVKLADFGTSRFLQLGELAQTFCGTITYMAPEIQLRKRYNNSADLWSTGLLLLRCIAGADCFLQTISVMEDDLATFFLEYENSAKSLPLHFNSDCEISNGLKKLIEGLLIVKPDARLNFERFFHYFSEEATESSNSLNIKNTLYSKFEEMTFYASPAGTSNSNDVPSASDDQFVDDILHGHEHRFYNFSDVRVFVTTFNVNGRAPPEKLGKWLQFDNDNLPHLIAIGLQEMDLSLGTYVVENSIRQDEWLFTLKQNLPDAYKQVECVRLIGIFLVLYKHEKAKIRVSDFCTSVVATGFLRFGNKGGVGISLVINDTLVCFINSHFATGSNELNKRNQDFRDISQMRFSNGRTIYDHHVIFWLGDLNYRLNTALTYEEVVRECNNDGYKELFAFDQLKEQQRLKIAFNDFVEPDILSFKPTYKFDVGTSNWDTSEKRCVPAWCDRILWRSLDKHTKVQTHLYTSVDSVLFSDHKPVAAHFFLTVKTINQKKKNAIYEEILRESDKKANELLPQITLSSTEFNFGPVYYKQPTVLILTIRNTGKSATRFMFRPAQQSETMPDNWLSITPKSSLIEVGAQIDITLQVVVDNEQAWKITDGNSSELMCILVIGLDQGRDHFVIVQANYQKSCFGSSFIALLEKPNVLPQTEDWLTDLSDNSSQTSEVNGDPRVPIIVFWLINALRIRGLKNIKFDESFSENTFYRIRDCLDQGRYKDLLLSPTDVTFTSSIYSAFLQLLDSFKESIIPEICSINGLNMEDPYSYSRFRATLPPSHLNMFDYLIEFFRDLMIENLEAQSQVPLLADLIFRKKPMKRVSFLR
uniref:Protein kinase domain-containing protein n=1 Tax=Acrobeloides nanus TaxID=290746 RepID=A0A914DX46_9BILA